MESLGINPALAASSNVMDQVSDDRRSDAVRRLSEIKRCTYGLMPWIDLFHAGLMTWVSRSSENVLSLRAERSMRCGEDAPAHSSDSRFPMGRRKR